MLVVHLDDGGNRRDPIVTLAGYMAIDTDWAKFETEARAYFDENGVRVLHTVDLHHLRGEFEGWEREEAKEFASGLFEILSRYCQVGLEFSVVKKQFEKRKREYPVKREKGPFAFCFKGMASRLLQNEAIKIVLPWEGVDLSFVVEAGNGVSRSGFKAARGDCARTVTNGPRLLAPGGIAGD